MDSIQTFHDIITALDLAGLDAHLEGGGAACAYIEIDYRSERAAHRGDFFILGDVNENWCVDEYSSRNKYENGEAPRQSSDLGIDSSSNDVEAITKAVCTFITSQEASHA